MDRYRKGLKFQRLYNRSWIVERHEYYVTDLVRRGEAVGKAASRPAPLSTQSMLRRAPLRSLTPNLVDHPWRKPPKPVDHYTMGVLLGSYEDRLVASLAQAREWARLVRARRLSIVTPTHNRPEKLRRLLGALALQSETDIEVIAVDDGGASSLALVAAEFGERLAVRILRQPRAGPAAARNTGAAAASGDWLGFLDDDCCPCPGWASAMLAALEETPKIDGGSALVGGRTVNAVRNNLFSQASQDIVNALSNQDAPDGDFVASNNCAASRAAFKAMGGFDTSYHLAGGEDRAFCRAWLRAGGRIIRAEAAMVEHYHELDLNGFWRQHRTYGRGARRFHLSGNGKGRLPVAGRIRFYMQICRYPLKQEPDLHGLARAALVGLAQVATAAGWAADAYAEAGHAPLDAAPAQPEHGAADETAEAGRKASAVPIDQDDIVLNRRRE